MKKLLMPILLTATSFAQSPIVCNLKALTASEREHHEAVTRKLKAAIADVKELSNGFSFRLSPGIRIAEVGEWIEAERKCCPFLDFQLRLEREGGPIQLSL